MLKMSLSTLFHSLKKGIKEIATEFPVLRIRLGTLTLTTYVNVQICVVSCEPPAQRALGSASGGLWVQKLTTHFSNLFILCFRPGLRLLSGMASSVTVPP